MPVLARRRYEIGEPVEELKRREFDDAMSSRPLGLPSTIPPAPVGRFVSGQHVADAGDPAGWAADPGQSLQCKGGPGAVPQQVFEEPVWRLFGMTGLGTSAWPAPDTPVGTTVGYHVRSGKHDLLEYDWQRFADFADRTLPQPRSAIVPGEFRPPQDSLPVAPPPGATLLFGDGSEGPPRFTSMAGGPLDWRVEDGALVVRPSSKASNHVVSTMRFRDAHIHAEFMTSPVAHGNSGLYIHGHYEMQIYDSAGKPSVTAHDEGGFYRFAAPLVNAARPAGEWQVYDVQFIAPRRNAAGRITTSGRITAWLNGRLVQDGVEFTEPRSPFTPYRHGVTDHLRGVERDLRETGEGPLFLQDHGSPARFRNVWIKPLDAG